MVFLPLHACTLLTLLQLAMVHPVTALSWGNDELLCTQISKEVVPSTFGAGLAAPQKRAGCASHTLTTLPEMKSLCFI